MSEYDNERQREWVKNNLERRKAIQKKSYEKNREKVLQATKDWRRRNHARVLLAQCKRSKNCTLTLEDIEALMAPGVCSVTGTPLTLEYSGSSKRNPWAPSIDRLDNSKGYHLGNVRLVCCAFNIMRNDFPDDVVKILARNIVENWK